MLIQKYDVIMCATFALYLCVHVARRRECDHLPDDKNLSVSSHDGGDEYSSEASELDSTKHVC